MLVPLNIPTRREALKVARIRIRLICQGPTTQKQLSSTAYGAVILMIAFLLSSLVIGLGGRILGFPDVRVRMGLSLGFFLFVFVALVIYENIRRRYG